MSTLSVQSITGVSSFDFSNTTFANAYSVANGGYVVANSVFSQSNNEVTRLSAAYVVANASFSYGNSSYTVANAAFGKANNALPLSGGTMSGNINVGSNYLYVPHTGTTSGAGNTSVSAVKFGSYGRLQHTSLNNVPFLSWNAELFRSDFTGSGTGGPDYNTFRPDYAAGYYGFMSSSNGGFAFNLGPWGGAANTTINDFASHSSYAGGFDASKNWIVANGSIGIGSTSPVSPLSLKTSGTGISINFNVNGLTNAINRGGLINYWYDSGTTTYYKDLWNWETNGVCRIGTAGNERFKVDSSGRITRPYQPAFLGVGRSGGSALNTGGEANYTIWNPNSVQLNRGSYFNTTTGRYTCPVAGVYQVSIFLLCRYGSSGGAHNIAIFKNGATTSIIGRDIAYGSNEMNTGLVGLVDCAVNDILDIRVSNSSGCDFYPDFNSYTISLFG